MRADPETLDLMPAPAPAPRSKLPLPTLKVAAGTKGKRCGCGTTIYLVEQPSGRWAPITCSVPGGVVPSATTDGIGINHWIDCVQRDSHRVLFPRHR